ncbi:methyltransferase domain-containing protein [bacterium]|nr:methyltransferase domain-containing protein [bacterium]
MRGLSREPGARTRGMPLNWAAPFYEWYCPKIGLGRSFRERTLEFAGIRPGEKILDVGCGTGVLTRMAKERGGRDGTAIGIDPAPAMIGAARKAASFEGSRAEFRVAAVEALPFPDDCFDLVLSSLMLHHLPPDLKVQGLSEVKRVLRPGGRLLLVDIDRPEYPLWWALAWPLLFWHFTKSQLGGGTPEFIKEAGFREIERKGGWMKILGFWSARK